MAIVDLQSPAKINLLLNIVGKTPDGYHELETLIWPVDLVDLLSFELCDGLLEPWISIECDDPTIPVDDRNLVHRAVSLFFSEIGETHKRSVRVQLRKHIPAEAGLGGGSGNAAVALQAMNRLHDHPLSEETLHRIAAQLGSDVPFFLNPVPSLGLGRGERIQRLEECQSLTTKWVLLMRPGFGVSTAWAYQQLAYFPDLVKGKPGMATQCVEFLRDNQLTSFFSGCINALEIPVFRKFPYLKMACQFMEGKGALLSRMSGSGSTVFSIWDTCQEARTAWETFQSELGGMGWHYIGQLKGTQVASEAS